MPATIIFNQAGKPAGVAGKARNDTVAAVAVVCTNSTVEGSYIWTLQDVPIRSALVRGSVVTTSSFTFTPDAKGTYLVSLQTNGSVFPTENAASFIAVLSTGAKALGWRYMAAGEARADNITRAGLNFPGNVNTRGWGTDEDLQDEQVESATYDVINAVTTSPGAGHATLVRLNATTGQFDSSVIPAQGGGGADILHTTITAAVSYTTVPTDSVILCNGGAAQTVTFDNSAPPAGTARQLTIICYGDFSVTVRDPALNVLAILDSHFVHELAFISQDGTVWGVLANDPIGDDISIISIGAATNVYDICSLSGIDSNGKPQFSSAPATGPVTANPLILLLATTNGAAAGLGVLGYGLRTGMVYNYNVAGAPAIGLPVYVNNSAHFDTSPGTNLRQLGRILSGAGSAWNLYFDGQFMISDFLAGSVTFAKLANSAQSVITNPPSASTGDVVIDATANPRPNYYMAPAGNQTFDPTAATVSQVVTITKTTNSTNKLTLKIGAGAATAGYTVFQNGVINTNFDLPGSATNSATANHQWTLTIDVAHFIIYVSPPA